MRLTLRTLLAWLDDMLSPDEVSEIGRQVNESPFAKDLVEQIHKVTRQRRLTTPAWTGPDATDPNLVASYLDNELDADHVAEFERKCLTSSVHLAEVASVHQILSLIGQKAKVPDETRLRMYQLVKGREATKVRTLPAPVRDEPKPAAQPIQPWVSPHDRRQHALETWGPVAAVVALIAVLVVSAWKTVSPGGGGSGTPVARGPAVADRKNLGVAPLVVENKNDADAAAKASAVPAAETARTDATRDAAKKADVAKADAGTGSAAVEIPPGFAARARKPSGLLLRYQTETREWGRITEDVALKQDERILNLDPFRSTLEIGQAVVELVGQTEIVVGASTKAEAARLTLNQGRVVLHAGDVARPFEVTVGKRTVTLTPPAGSTVGVERVNRREPGVARASEPDLRVTLAEGSVAIGSGADAVTFKGPNRVTVGPEGKPVEDSGGKTAPAWLTDAGASAFDKQVGEQFLGYFRGDRPITTGLVEASEDEQNDVCRLAISALEAAGDDLSFVVPLLNKKGTKTAATVRHTAIDVLRAFLAKSPESAAALRQELERVIGLDLTPTAETLLVGYSEADERKPATTASLVQLLESQDDTALGIRQMAIDTLRHITGRDTLGYDPEKPTGPGLQAWKNLPKDQEPKAAPRPVSK